MTRILLVDDHEIVREKLHKMLEEQDAWQVCGEAENGQQAVDKFAKAKPDVVVMDFQMPEMNGLEATRQIIKRSPNTPILMLTVYATSQLMEQARRAGVKGFCPKSEVTCIVDAVATLLGGGTYFQN
jgi:DNA-binding NarL/FixJ family response regulator